MWITTRSLGWWRPAVDSPVAPNDVHVLTCFKLVNLRKQHHWTTMLHLFMFVFVHMMNVLIPRKTRQDRRHLEILSIMLLADHRLIPYFFPNPFVHRPPLHSGNSCCPCCYRSQFQSSCTAGVDLFEALPKMLGSGALPQNTSKHWVWRKWCRTDNRKKNWVAVPSPSEISEKRINKSRVAHVFGSTMPPGIYASLEQITLIEWKRINPRTGRRGFVVVPWFKNGNAGWGVTGQEFAARNGEQSQNQRLVINKKHGGHPKAYAI